MLFRSDRAAVEKLALGDGEERLEAIAALITEGDARAVEVLDALASGDLQVAGKRVLITSCAFGNVIPRVVEAAIEGGADRVLIADIIQNELVHAKTKLTQYANKVEYIEDNATALKQPDGVAAANIMFFLLHELPHELKGRALAEAGQIGRAHV